LTFQPFTADKIEAMRTAAEDWPPPCEIRSRPTIDSATRLWRAVAGYSQRCVGATSQYGDHCGNLLQRNTLHVLRDTAMALQQARARNGCPAITGANRTLRASWVQCEHCIATNPSDMCVAMAALEATITSRESKAHARSPW